MVEGASAVKLRKHVSASSGRGAGEACVKSVSLPCKAPHILPVKSLRHPLRGTGLDSNQRPIALQAIALPLGYMYAAAVDGESFKLCCQRTSAKIKRPPVFRGPRAGKRTNSEPPHPLILRNRWRRATRQIRFAAGRKSEFDMVFMPNPDSNASKKTCQAKSFYGGPDGNRTRDQRVFSPSLYR